MNCSPDYDFFNNIDKYITEVKKIENPTLPNTSLVDCKHFSNQEDLGNKEKAESLCNSFASLNKFLVPIKKEDHLDPCNFLNYWLNSELSQPFFNEDNCISYVYNVMDSHLGSKPDYNSLDCQLYNINKVELNKMNKLYNFYKNYSKLNTIIDSNWKEKKIEILTLSTQFVEPRYDFSDYFIILSKCPNTKIISTAVTGTVVGLIPLMGVLYKFTPMGQMFRSKIGILNKDISNNDEEMIKMSLMEKENEPIRFQKGTYNIKYQSL
ncbi:PIR protein [Plasmodium vivax]|uniref:VIR protein n=1 Tax=Plasmodium vivax TaxID=5855 RepID=A0A565A6Y6_PLAVI|nr:PIR protein [Plasmodium vivax]